MNNKEIELVNDLWQLWEDIQMAGQLVTNKEFSPKYRELKAQVKNLNMHLVVGRSEQLKCLCENCTKELDDIHIKMCYDCWEKL